MEIGLDIGTWNVRTLYQAGKLAQISRIMEQYHLAFLGMSEIRWNQFGQLSTSRGHLMLWSGMPNETDPHHRGVGVLVSKEYRKSVMSYKYVSERIMSLRLRGQPNNLSVVQCYAPTEDANDDVKQAFYDQLNNTLAEVPKHDLKPLMGDFNAIVGSDNEDLEHVIGKHGVGVMNNNGELLVELCGLNELRIGGTLFPHKDTHKATWVSPDSRTQNQIDHICISSKWSQILCDLRVKRGADIASDHHLLMGVVCFRLKHVPNISRLPRVKYRITKLKDPHQPLPTTCVTDLLM